MQLLRARVVGLGPIADLTFPFADDDGNARRTIVVLGGGGMGKTSLLSAIASTRPGFAVAPPRGRSSRADAVPHAMVDWWLGDDEPARPHPLRVTSPNAPDAEKDDAAPLRRREQALFDRRATEGGFALVAFSGARWFSRTPVVLTQPDRTLARYDVRTAASFDDPTRVDLTRETKGVLSFASIGAALARAARGSQAGTPTPLEALDAVVRAAVAPLARLAGMRFSGVDPMTLEPLFEHEATGAVMAFDELPQSVRHLVAFGALTARALSAAYPGHDARQCEGVALIDDADLHQDVATQRALVPALREALPNVQWILTTSSPALALACDAAEVLALRRMPEGDAVELYEGESALVH